MVSLSCADVSRRRILRSAAEVSLVSSSVVLFPAPHLLNNGAYVTRPGLRFRPEPGIARGLCSQNDSERRPPRRCLGGHQLSPRLLRHTSHGLECRNLYSRFVDVWSWNYGLQEAIASQFARRSGRECAPALLECWDHDF